MNCFALSEIIMKGKTDIMHNAISCGVKAPDYDYMECCQMDFNLEKLDALGADTQEGISRIMGNQALYVAFLKKFVEKNRAEEIRQALRENDYEALLLHTHDNKGTTGNLSLNCLYSRYSDIVSHIREENYAMLEAEVEEVLALQEMICGVIEEL